MARLELCGRVAISLAPLLLCVGNACAMDIGGTISATLTVTEDSQLVDDVTCTVTDAPCITVAASDVTLELNGFNITGLADPQTTCSAGPMTFVPGMVEDGIELTGQTNVAIHGPGLVQRFRGPGIFALNSNSLTVTGVTIGNNCMSGILVGGGSGHNISRNLALRNGSRVFACGGIWLYGGASHSRLRANRLSGNGYLVQGNNFGIGIEGSGTNDNVVEENSAFGNSNGLFLTAGVKGNIISGNLFVGNPSVQVSADHSPDNSFDIKNLAADGDNTFRGNICFTSTNAPCSAVVGQSTPRQ